jgi:hypothetical protein
MFVFEDDANCVIDAARSAFTETDFFQRLARMTASDSEDAISGLESMRELLKYGQLIKSSVIDSPDMF